MQVYTIWDRDDLITVCSTREKAVETQRILNGVSIQEHTIDVIDTLNNIEESKMNIYKVALDEEGNTLSIVNKIRDCDKFEYAERFLTKSHEYIDKYKRFINMVIAANKEEAVKKAIENKI